jgi:hypothetical protein
LRVLYRFIDARGPEDLEEMRYLHDGLTVWFGPKSELSQMQRDCYAALNYRPARGTRMPWPSILNHRPGYLPWAPDADEVAWLAAAIPAIMRYAELRVPHRRAVSYW